MYAIKKSNAFTPPNFMKLLIARRHYAETATKETDRQTDRRILLHIRRSVCRLYFIKNANQQSTVTLCCTATSLLGTVSHWVGLPQKFLNSSPFPERYSHPAYRILLSLFLLCVRTEIYKLVATQGTKVWIRLLRPKRRRKEGRKEEQHTLRSWTQ